MYNKYIYDLIFDINTKYIDFKGKTIEIKKIKRYINKYDVYINDEIYINIEEIKEAFRCSNSNILVLK